MSVLYLYAKSNTHRNQDRPCCSGTQSNRSWKPAIYNMQDLAAMGGWGQADARGVLGVVFTEVVNYAQCARV